MTITLYTLVPMLSIVLFTMSLTMKIYKRSVSSFITIIMVAVASNSMYYGYINFGLVTIVVLMVVMFLRAVTKADTDSFLIHRHKEKERIEC